MIQSEKSLRHSRIAIGIAIIGFIASATFSFISIYKTQSVSIDTISTQVLELIKEGGNDESNIQEESLQLKRSSDNKKPERGNK